ncbi:hypothetical protein BDV32DRAFT_130549, partial [Aspergillus pseudonomiae]
MLIMFMVILMLTSLWFDMSLCGFWVLFFFCFQIVVMDFVGKVYGVHSYCSCYVVIYWFWDTL